MATNDIDLMETLGLMISKRKQAAEAKSVDTWMGALASAVSNVDRDETTGDLHMGILPFLVGAVNNTIKRRTDRRELADKEYTSALETMKFMNVMQQQEAAPEAKAKEFEMQERTKSKFDFFKRVYSPESTDAATKGGLIRAALEDLKLLESIPPGEFNDVHAPWNSGAQVRHGAIKRVKKAILRAESGGAISKDESKEYQAFVPKEGISGGWESEDKVKADIISLKTQLEGTMNRLDPINVEKVREYIKKARQEGMVPSEGGYRRMTDDDIYDDLRRAGLAP